MFPYFIELGDGEKCTNVHYVQNKETGWSTNLPSDLP